MPWSLHRFQNAHDVHFITFSCYKRQPRFRSAASFNTFERTLGRVRKWYGLTINAYVVMPEHVHLLLHEPERGSLAVAIQMLKQRVGTLLKPLDGEPFWQRRYFDRNVHSTDEIESARAYIHRNPVKRGLCAQPQDWRWSSCLHYMTGVEGVVEIESQWTARKRERLGIVPVAKWTGPPKV